MDLHPDVKQELERILDKNPEELTPDEQGFIKARRGYLNNEQKRVFASVLVNEGGQPEEPKKPEQPKVSVDVTEKPEEPEAPKTPEVNQEPEKPVEPAVPPMGPTGPVTPEPNNPFAGSGDADPDADKETTA